MRSDRIRRGSPVVGKQTACTRVPPPPRCRIVSRPAVRSAAGARPIRLSPDSLLPVPPVCCFDSEIATVRQSDCAERSSFYRIHNNYNTNSFYAYVHGFFLLTSSRFIFSLPFPSDRIKCIFYTFHPVDVTTLDLHSVPNYSVFFTRFFCIRMGRQ